MRPDDEGGEAACLAHLDSAPQAVVADLSAITEFGGAVWGLRQSAGDDVDLDVNLIRLVAGASIGSHINRELDVLIVVQAGLLALTIDDAEFELAVGSIGFVPRGSRRSITAASDGASYLSIHRRRAPLQPFRH